MKQTVSLFIRILRKLCKWYHTLFLLQIKNLSLQMPECRTVPSSTVVGSVRWLVSPGQMSSRFVHLWLSPWAETKRHDVAQIAQALLGSEERKVEVTYYHKNGKVDLFRIPCVLFHWCNFNSWLLKVHRQETPKSQLKIHDLFIVLQKSRNVETLLSG